MGGNSGFGNRTPVWLASLKGLDAFPKQREEAAEFFTKTMSGGIITLTAAVFMTLLFFSELRELDHVLFSWDVHMTPATSCCSAAAACLLRNTNLNAPGGAPALMPYLACVGAGLFMRVNTVNELFVDTSRGEQLEIHVRGLAFSCIRRHEA